ncbi:MAG: hypothetical protein LQ349_004791 [Xanthoria aureola]|nr:MAG: hypothetical protein LQ349_004791 [Xanthoria aureola]
MISSTDKAQVDTPEMGQGCQIGPVGDMWLYVLLMEFATLRELMSLLAVFVYGILLMDWGTNDNIFKDVSLNHWILVSKLTFIKVREWFNVQSSSVWTTRPGPSFDPVSDATKTNRSPGESRSRP